MLHGLQRKYLAGLISFTNQDESNQIKTCTNKKYFKYLANSVLQCRKYRKKAQLQKSVYFLFIQANVESDSTSTALTGSYQSGTAFTQCLLSFNLEENTVCSKWWLMVFGSLYQIEMVASPILNPCENLLFQKCHKPLMGLPENFFCQSIPLIFICTVDWCPSLNFGTDRPRTFPPLLTYSREGSTRSCI